jgi:hypothetical protein
MSRKHFEALAREISEAYANAATPEARTAVAEMAGRIARVCSDNNPNFSDKRFLAACGIGC